jgi:hypothetical protein
MANPGGAALCAAGAGAQCTYPADDLLWLLLLLLHLLLLYQLFLWLTGSNCCCFGVAPASAAPAVAAG